MESWSENVSARAYARTYARTGGQTTRKHNASGPICRMTRGTKLMSWFNFLEIICLRRSRHRISQSSRYDYCTALKEVTWKCDYVRLHCNLLVQRHNAGGISLLGLCCSDVFLTYGIEIDNESCSEKAVTDGWRWSRLFDSAAVERRYATCIDTAAIMIAAARRPIWHCVTDSDG